MSGVTTTSKESVDYGDGVRKKSRSIGDNDVSDMMASSPDDVTKNPLSNSFTYGAASSSGKRKGMHSLSYPAFGLNDKLTRLLLANESTKAMSSSYSSNISNYINSNYSNCSSTHSAMGYTDGSLSLNMSELSPGFAQSANIRSPTLSMADIAVVVPEGLSPCLDDNEMDDTAFPTGDVDDKKLLSLKTKASVAPRRAAEKLDEADELVSNGTSQIVSQHAEEISGTSVMSKPLCGFGIDDSGYSESDPPSPNESSPELPRSDLSIKPNSPLKFDTVSLSSSSLDSQDCSSSTVADIDDEASIRGGILETSHMSDDNNDKWQFVTRTKSKRKNSHKKGKGNSSPVAMDEQLASSPNASDSSHGSHHLRNEAVRNKDTTASEQRNNRPNRLRNHSRSVPKSSTFHDGPGLNVHTVSVNKVNDTPRLSTTMSSKLPHGGAVRRQTSTKSSPKVTAAPTAPPRKNTVEFPPFISTVEFPPFVTTDAVQGASVTSSSLTSSVGMSFKHSELVAASEASVPSFLMPDECCNDVTSPSDVMTSQSNTVTSRPDAMMMQATPEHLEQSNTPPVASYIPQPSIQFEIGDDALLDTDDIGTFPSSDQQDNFLPHQINPSNNNATNESSIHQENVFQPLPMDLVTTIDSVSINNVITSRGVCAAGRFFSGFLPYRKLM